jgi:protein-tyrosine phosphatase
MPLKILMVCLGNICRSPLAEGIMRSKLTADYYIDSAGTGGWHAGEAPDKRSIQTARNHGIDISKQSARKFSITDFDTFDVIFVMDQSNYKDVLHLAPNETARSKVQLLLDNSKEVPDPYYGTLEDFEQVYHLLNQSCEAIARKLKQ